MRKLPNYIPVESSGEELAQCTAVSVSLIDLMQIKY